MKKIINAQRIIKTLGGPKSFTDTHKKIAQANGFEELKLNTVSGWSSKQYLRWHRLPDVFAVAEHLGFDLDIRKFIEEVDE